jgi:ABC-type glutathione transport system ATPase component
VAVLLATHDRTLAAAGADRVLVLDDGRVVGDGDAPSVIAALTGTP